MLGLACAFAATCSRSDGGTVIQQELSPGPQFTLIDTLSVAGDPALTFGQVVSGVILEDGGSAIADRFDQSVTVLDGEGRASVRLGGEGQGPGEIGFLASLAVAVGDTVLIEDDGNGRFLLMHGGRIVRSVQVRQWNPWQFTLVTGSSPEVLVHTSSFPGRFTEEWYPGLVVRLDVASGRLDTVADYPLAPNESLRASRFVGTGRVSSAGPDLLSVRPDRAGVGRRTRSDSTWRWVSLDLPTRLVTDSVWGEYRSWFLADPAMSLDRATREQLFDQLLRPRRVALPAIGELIGDPCGNAWLGEFSPDPRRVSRYFVISSAGEPLATIALPNRARILDVRQGRVLAVSVDELGRQTVTMYSTSAVPGVGCEGSHR